MEIAGRERGQMPKKPRRGFSGGGLSFPEAWLLRNIPCREDTPFTAPTATEITTQRGLVRPLRS
jgi:hypothetical protein